MKYERIKLKVKEIMKEYLEVGFSGEKGIYACGGSLTVALPYSSVNDLAGFYLDGVVFSVLSGMPLGSIYFLRKPSGYEVIDGKKRLIALCRYIAGKNPSAYKTPFSSLSLSEKERVFDYEVEAIVVDGTREELAEWLKITNAHEYVSREQEVLNSCCGGEWIEKAKEYFSGRNCKAYKLGADLMSGTPENQDYLAKVLSWIADEKGFESGKEYMLEHADDPDADELIAYFEHVVEWVFDVFPARRKERKGVEWGLLYNRFRDEQLDAYELDIKIEKLFADGTDYDRQGVFAYVLTENKKYLFSPFNGV